MAKATKKNTPKKQLTEKRERGRPRREDKDNENVRSVEKKTLPGEARKTYILKIEFIEKAQKIADKEDIKLKDVVNGAFEAYIKAYEKKNGPLK